MEFVVTESKDVSEGSSDVNTDACFSHAHDLVYLLIVKWRHKVFPTMVSVDIPQDLHDAVEEYAETHGISMSRAYVELIEYALNNIEPEDDDDDLRSGIA